MNDPNYLRLVADAIALVGGRDSDTSARLRDVAHRIELLEARPTKADIESTHVLVPRSTTLANLIVGMDRAYEDVPSGVYQELLSDVAQLKAKVWDAIDTLVGA